METLVVCGSCGRVGVTSMAQMTMVGQRFIGLHGKGTRVFFDSSLNMAVTSKARQMKAQLVFIGQQHEGIII